MGSVGDCFDNAVAESFFATLECELLDRRSWPTRRELSSAVFDFIEAFYNRRRRHSTLGYLSPADYEANACPPGAVGLDDPSTNRVDSSPKACRGWRPRKYDGRKTGSSSSESPAAGVRCLRRRSRRSFQVPRTTVSLARGKRVSIWLADFAPASAHAAARQPAFLLGTAHALRASRRA